MVSKMVIDVGLVLTKVDDKDVLTATKDIDVSGIIFLYLNGVPTYQIDPEQVSGRVVDVTSLPVTINDELTLMYDELI